MMLSQLPGLCPTTLNLAIIFWHSSYFLRRFSLEIGVKTRYLNDSAQPESFNHGFLWRRATSL